MITLDNKPWLQSFRIEKTVSYPLAGELMRDVIANFPRGHFVRITRWRQIVIAAGEANAIIHRIIKESKE